jgi:hypothetical protein
MDFEGNLLKWEEIGFKIVRRIPLHQRLNFKTLTMQAQCFLSWFLSKDNASPTGLVLFWENLVQNFYSIAPNGVFRMSNRAP